MPKISDFGHPRVKLQYKTVEQSGRWLLLSQVCDAETGEILMEETLLQTTEWFRDMGYKWLEGSQGVWQQ